MAPPWLPAVGFTLAPSLGGFVGSYYVRGEGLRWYASLQKPSWHPPRWTLGPIWGTLYSAMGEWRREGETEGEKHRSTVSRMRPDQSQPRSLGMCPKWGLNQRPFALCDGAQPTEPRRYGSYLVWKELGGFSEEAVVPLGLYAGQLTLNWAWPPIFFGARQVGWALVDLLMIGGLAAATTVTWYKVSPPAARLLYPYLAWLAFASVLNYCVWRDNHGRRGGRRLAE